MKQYLLAGLLLLNGWGLPAQSLSFKAKTGDADFDLTLNEMNVQAKTDIKLFRSDLSVSFGVTEGKIDELSVKFKMEPADIYMTLELAKQSGKTVDVVAQAYQKNKTKGWGVIAKELGIKPGSPAFHALKDSAKGKNKKMKEKKNNPSSGGKEKSKGNGKGKNK